MCMKSLLVLVITIGLTNARKTTNGPLILQTLTSSQTTGNDEASTGCICSFNNTICSQPGCSRGDNLDCNSFQGNIYYSVASFYNDYDYTKTISACACPNYSGNDNYDFTNAIFINDDAVYSYNYTTCDNIATGHTSPSTTSEFSKNAVNCCYYCCTDLAVGGD